MASEVLTGTVEIITFHNDENGFTVCKVRPSGNDHLVQKPLVPLVGNVLSIWTGEEIRAEGEWVYDTTHGRQFKAREITCITPTSLEGIRLFLASGMIRGIGKVTAEKIVAHFGRQTLEVLDNQSERLKEIEGIGEAKRKKIRDSWIEQSAVRNIMIFLQSYGISIGKAARIYRRYGAGAVAVVKQNPYRLARDVWGIGFETADKIALNLGFARDSELRARAGVHHVLQHEEDEGGNCFSPVASLLLEAQSLLAIPVERLQEALRHEVDSGRLIQEEDRIYRKDVFFAERNVADRLALLLKMRPSFPPIQAERAVEWAEKQGKITFGPDQRKALLTAISSKVTIITGGPGVGKTTVVKAITDVFSAKHLSICLASPTGRAAKRLSESTGLPASTIHRLLKYQPNGQGFVHDCTNPLEGDCFILDEVSMLDIRLTNSLLQAIPPEAVLILVGDCDQLPSVGPGNVLRDLIASGRIPCCRLERVFRQDQSGYIVRNAHHINRGESLELGAADADFFYVDAEDPDRILQMLRQLVTQRIPAKFGFDPRHDVQILTPMNLNSLGALNINIQMQALLNPTGDSLKRGELTFRVGDRVMQIRNDAERDVFNGDIGYIAAADEVDRTLCVDFDGRIVNYSQDSLDELALAYACTIHKSQGSEYPVAIVILHTQHFKLLQRNLLYTAVTRGRKLVVLIAKAYALQLALRNNDTRQRRTTLCPRLVKLLARNQS
ncbi:MAG: ATP-dependent RecD-like DNA helicase [Kiritimatiellia bacterium]